MAAARVVYESTILCDEIRQEITGKSILLGVIGSELLFPSFPSLMSMCFYAEGNVVEAGEFRSKIRVIDDVENILFNGPYGITYNFVPGRFSQAEKLQFSVQREGLISIIATDGGDNEHVLLRRQIKLIRTNGISEDIVKMLDIPPQLPG
jgi:hypothetical protein